MKTSYDKTELDTSGFHWIINFNWSYHCHGYADNFFLIGSIFLLLLLGPLIVFVRVMVSVNYIEFNGHIVIGKPQSVCFISGDIILGILDAPIPNIIQAINITLF